MLIFFLPSTCRTNLFSVAPSEGFVLSLCSSALSYLKGLRQLGVTSLSSPPSFLQGREAGQASLFPSSHAAALDASWKAGLVQQPRHPGQGEQQEHCVLLGSIPSSRAGRAGQLAVGWDPAELTSPRSVLRIHLSCSMPPRDKQAAGPPWGCSELVLAHSRPASSTRLSSGSRPVPGGGVAGTSEGLILPGSLHSTSSQTRGLPHGVLVWLWGRQEQSLGRVPAAGRRWGCGVPRGFQRLVPGISGE